MSQPEKMNLFLSTGRLTIHIWNIDWILNRYKQEPVCYNVLWEWILALATNLQEHDKRHQIKVAILDFFEAFVTAPPIKLIHKPISNKSKYTWMAFKPPYCQINAWCCPPAGKCPATYMLTLGVPKGIVLRSFLFLCHINNLPDSETSSVRLLSWLYKTNKTD